MLVKPTVLELLNKVDNRFELVTMTAKRARQIAAGSTPLTKKEEPSPVSLPLDEMWISLISVAAIVIEILKISDIFKSIIIIRRSLILIKV